MIKNLAIGVLSITTVFFGYHFFSGQGEKQVESETVMSKSTAVGVQEVKDMVPAETKAVVSEGKMEYRPIEDIKSKMSESALKQVGQLEQMGLNVKFHDNKDGTMAVQIAHNDGVVKIDKIEKTEQWQRKEEAILAVVNRDSSKTEISDREREIIEKWNNDHE